LKITFFNLKHGYFQTGRGVPVIIPSDARDTLQFLADSDVRKKAGILRDNPYLFANNGKQFLLCFLLNGGFDYSGTFDMVQL